MTIASICLGITSCDPETDVAPGGTAVEKLAGEWQVHNEVIKITATGDSVNYVDPYGYGDFIFRTYNTAANTADKIFIYETSFWTMKAVCSCDLNTNKIFTEESSNLLAEDPETVKVNGKIIPKGCLNIHGAPNDSICIDVEFSSDPGTIYRYAGARYTGFYE